MSNSDGELTGVFAAIHRIATQMISMTPITPRTLRVRAGDISVELEWEDRVAEPKTFEEQIDCQRDEGGLIEPQWHYVLAPTVGVFYRAATPGAVHFVDVGSAVDKGQQVGIVEAMKMMIPVEAAEAGVVAKILVGNAEAVEYAQELVAIEPVNPSGTNGSPKQKTQEG